MKKEATGKIKKRFILPIALILFVIVRISNAKLQLCVS